MELKIPLVDFNRIRILPNSPVDINSRSECDTKIEVNKIVFGVPVLAPPMHYLYSEELSRNLEVLGSVAIVPRDYNGERYLGMTYIVNTSLDKAIENAIHLRKTHVPNKVLSIEISNGHMRRLGDIIKEVKDIYPELTIWAGTVCTDEGAQYLGECGADSILVGIGIGSVCLTTPNTGVGLPAFSTVLICSQCDYPIILTGGIREFGDIPKAILAGASLVYVGNLLKGCSDIASPKMAWGEASSYQKKSYHHVEGKVEYLEAKNKTSLDIITEIKEHLQSAMSFVGAKTIGEFQNIGRYVVLD